MKQARGEKGKAARSLKPGRPPASGETIGRDAMLEAAERVFRRMPPAQVTRLAIAAEAGVDPNLVRYYFGTVQNLITEIVLRSHRQIFDDLDDRAERMEAPDWFRMRIGEWLHLFIDNPFHHQQLLMVMYGDLASDAHAAWQQSLDRSVGYTRTSVERGVEAGELRSVDPRFLHVAMLGMAEFFANNEGILRDMFGPEVSPSTLREEYGRFLFDLIMNGLRKREA